MPRKTVHNNIVTEELLEKVNPKNANLLNEFIEYLNSTNKSDLTIYNYTSDLHICFVWSLLHNDNKFFVEFTKRDFMKYQSFLLNELKLGSSRIRRLRSALSSLSNFIENILDDDFPTFKNIVNKIAAPVSEAIREKTIMTEEQIQQLFDYLLSEKKYQKACLFALALSSGARKSELLRFKVDYFKEENIIYDSLYKTNEKIKTKGRGKGKYIFKYVLVSQFKPYLDLWLKQREELGIDSEWLFVSQREDGYEQMIVSTLDHWAETFSKVLGLDFYFHSLRHYFTTRLYNSGLPGETIKDIIGWQSVAMVSLYLDVDTDEEIGKYFDKDGIKETKAKGLSEI